MIRGRAPDALEFAWQRQAACSFPDSRRRSQDGAASSLQHRTDDRQNSAATDENARLALVTAGYKSSEARTAVENARSHVGVSATLEQVIREALRQCAISVRGAPLPSNA